jgi:glycosyltransferase involved in cell wall biosynthesis
LDSLAVQDDRDFEVVVSDGASTDATLSVVNEYMTRLPRLTVQSRKDLGVYDAINKALPECKGSWVFILGSDDRLHEASTLRQVLSTLRLTSASFVYGDVRVIGKNAMVADGGRYGGTFSLARLMGENICQQCAFYRRDLFDRIGTFDVRYRLWADWDYALKVFVHEKVQWINTVVADYMATGMSSGAQDGVFRATRSQRLYELWLSRPWSAAVPLAIMRNLYWELCSRR